MGTLAEYFNILIAIYISLPIILLLFIAFLFLVGKPFTKETTEKLIDFGKWYMASIVIVLTVKIIDSSYTEREINIKEIAVYDKYATTIIEADNLEKRWKLAEYFATVTPSERLRKRWIAYQTIIKPEYKALRELNKKRNQLLLRDSLNHKQESELLRIDQKVTSLNKSLSNDQETDYLIIVFSTDKTLGEAIFENKKLKKVGISDAYVVRKGALYFNVSRDYSSIGNASSELMLIKKVVRKDVYIVSSKKFCKNRTVTEECTVCD